MQLLKNKRVIVSVVAIAAIVGIWLANRSTETIKEEELMDRVQKGYTQQFCGVIFPRISSCVTVNVSQCPHLVAKNLDACLLQLKLDLPANVTLDEGKVIYDKVGVCFQQQIHDDLVTNSLVNSDECRQKLS